MQFLQPDRVQDPNGAPGQLDHTLALEVPEHPGDHLPVGAQVVGDGLVIEKET